MPEYIVKVTYTEQLIRSAAFLYWKTAIGKSTLISIVAIVLSCVVLAVLGVERLIVGFFSGIAVIGAAIVIATYFSVRRQSLSIFRKMRDKTATFTFTGSGIGTEADTGKAEIPWERIEKVLQFPDFWLFSVAKGSYFTLPIASVPAETRAFILSKIG